MHESFETQNETVGGFGIPDEVDVSSITYDLPFITPWLKKYFQSFETAMKLHIDCLLVHCVSGNIGLLIYLFFLATNRGNVFPHHFVVNSNI